MPKWIALTDLTLPGPLERYIQAGETFDAPLDWKPPTNGVQPLDPGAAFAYWQEGPRGMSDAEINRATYTNGQRWTGQVVPPATTRWVRVGKSDANGFILSGAGSNYGPRPPM